MMMIRTSLEMAPDRNGVHATGREVWGRAAAGNWCWLTEFETDDTVDLPTTETESEWWERRLDMMER